MNIFRGGAIEKNPQIFFSFTGNIGKSEKKAVKDNWLGNVNVVISDKKIPVDDNNDGTVDYYRADVRSVTDYYGGGMIMPGRNFNAGDYKFGMNGQEKMDEIASGHYTAEYWEYDSRIIRRWENDPIIKPHESPYACFANNPIWFTDKVGLDAEDPPIGFESGKGTPENPVELPEVEIKPQETPSSPSFPTQPSTPTNKAPATINLPNIHDIEVGRNQLPAINQVIPNTAWRTQAPNWTACFKTCKTILTNNGVNNPAPPNLLIQMTKENIKKNGLNISPTANQGITAINGSLQNGVPIIVGVNHTFGKTANEGTTDHFVIIISRGYDQGRLYYKFFDVGTQSANMGTSDLNRLYLQNNNTLIGTTQYNLKKYTVSQVRPNGQ